MALDRCRRVPLRQASPALQGMATPLQWEVWQEAMASHPDRDFMEYIIAGLRESFRIGYDYQGHKCKGCEDNMKSAKEHPQVVDDYIMKECLAGRLLGPLDPQMFTEVQVSRFGVITKSEPGSWRLILYLSSPVRAIVSTGEGAMLAKVDIKSAYRIIPVHPEDRPLLGMRWREALYVDSALPFGLRSAPKLFNSVADVLEWKLKHMGIQQVFHYLDDFLIVAPPHSPCCKEELRYCYSALTVWECQWQVRSWRVQQTVSPFWVLN